MHEPVRKKIEQFFASVHGKNYLDYLKIHIPGPYYRPTE